MAESIGKLDGAVDDSGGREYGGSGVRVDTSEKTAGHLEGTHEGDQLVSTERATNQ